MANTFYQEPIDGGDLDNWGRKDQEQPRRSIGEISCKLYDDSGTLKCKVGRVGFDDGSKKGTVYIDTETTISLAGVSNSNWALVEISVSGTTPTIAATDLSGATDESQVYTTFTSFYDQEKGGFYVTATKRVIGLVYKDSGGSLSSILNCMSGENFLLKWAAGGTLHYVNGVSLLYDNILHIQDQKTAGTAGGTFTSGAWRTRDLNTVVTNTIQGASLSSNQFTLPPGKYRITAIAPVYLVNENMAKLRNITDSTDDIWGASNYASSASAGKSTAIVKGEIEISGTKVFEIQHRCATSGPGNSFGISNGGLFTVDHETYTDAYIERIA